MDWDTIERLLRQVRQKLPLFHGARGPLNQAINAAGKHEEVLIAGLIRRAINGLGDDPDPELLIKLRTALEEAEA